MLGANGAIVCGSLRRELDQGLRTKLSRIMLINYRCKLFRSDARTAKGTRRDTRCKVVRIAGPVTLGGYIGEVDPLSPAPNKTPITRTAPLLDSDIIKQPRSQNPLA
jgi:hypothetical protein